MLAAHAGKMSERYDNQSSGSGHAERRLHALMLVNPVSRDLNT
jgi:hypothetical protein